MTNEGIITYKEEDIDANQGFPIFRGHISNLSFKKKVIEYLSVCPDKYSKQKKDIIYKSFSFSEKEKFNDKYSDYIATIYETYTRISRSVRLMFNVRDQVEANLREVFVHERNIEWLNNIITTINEIILHHGSDKNLLKILNIIRSYESSVNVLKISKNENTGLLELDSRGFDIHITTDIKTIIVCMQYIKAELISFKSFLSEHKIKDLYPSYIRDIEIEVECFDVINERFSSRKGNIIRKKSKKSRSEYETNLLEEIETNERKGYCFPDYANISPDDSHINDCQKIWKTITTK